MRIVVDIGHPAHVHFFKNFVWEMEKRGHEILITASKKDVSIQLLDAYGFDYIHLGSYGFSIAKKVINIPVMDLRMYKAVKDFNPDIFVGSGSVRAAHVSKMLRKPCIVFTDAEHRRLQNWLYRPFADYILSSYTFKDTYGKKHIKYNGFDELAYLHPKYFSPNSSVLDELNLKKNDRFILLRLVLWNVRDIGQSGFNFKSERDTINFIRTLESYNCQVLISSEKKLPSALEPYSIKIAPEKMHDLLYFSLMYIGEGATMAAEAAILGTPSIYVSSIPLGYLNELRDKYGLVYTCLGYEDALKIAIELLNDPKLKLEWKGKREELIKESIDVTEFMVNFIESYPDSVEELKYARK